MPEPFTALPDLARALAERLPGTWTTTRSSELSHSPLAAVLRPATVIVGPQDTRILLLDHPHRPDRAFAFALTPGDLGGLFLYNGTIPHTVGLDRTPARAAATVAHRFLPRYRAIVEQRRLHALAEALGGIEQAQAAWDAVSDRYCGTDGYILDARRYDEGITARDSAAWGHLAGVLTYGRHLLEAAQADADRLTATGQADNRWPYRLKALTAALDGGQQVLDEWQANSTSPAFDPQDDNEAADDRNAEGWHYAVELAAHAPVLFEITQATGRLPAPTAALLTGTAPATSTENSNRPSQSTPGTSTSPSPAPPTGPQHGGARIRAARASSPTPRNQSAAPTPSAPPGAVPPSADRSAVPRR